MHGDIPVLGLVIFLGVVGAFFFYVEATRSREPEKKPEAK